MILRHVIATASARSPHSSLPSFLSGHFSSSLLSSANKLLRAFFVLQLLLSPKQLIVTGCEEKHVAKCFTDTLDEWGSKLYGHRQKADWLDSGSCDSHSKITECINYDGCRRDQTIEISRRLTELLHYHKEPGNILQSYFAMEYACSDEGRPIVQANRECLKKYRFGEEVLHLTRKIEDHIDRQSPDADGCSIIKELINQEVDGLKRHCNSDRKGGMLKLVCKSVFASFKNSRQFTESDFSCDDSCDYFEGDREAGGDEEPDPDEGSEEYGEEPEQPAERPMVPAPTPVPKKAGAAPLFVTPVALLTAFACVAYLGL